MHLSPHPFVPVFHPSLTVSYIHPVIPSVHSFLHSLVHSSLHSCIFAFIQSLLRQFIESFLNMSVHSFFPSIIPSYTHYSPALKWLLHSLLPSFIHTVTLFTLHSLLHPIIPTCIHACPASVLLSSIISSTRHLQPPFIYSLIYAIKHSITC